MTVFKNIVVIGGSGNVGRHILAALAESKDDFGTISSLKREGFPTSEVLKELVKNGVRVIEADFKDKASLVKAFEGADVVISTVNVPAFQDQYLFLDAAIEAKVKRFFPSEFGSNTSLPDVANIPYLQPKLKFQHYIEEKAKQGLIEYTFVNNGGLAEYAIVTEFYGVNFQKRTFHRIGDGKSLCTFTALPDVGKYMIAILKRPELTKNADILISSYDSDYVAIIDALEAETGDKFAVIEQTPEEQIKAGAPETLVEMRAMLLDGRGVLAREGYKLWNDKFPEVKPMTLKEVTKECLKGLQE